MADSLTLLDGAGDKDAAATPATPAKGKAPKPPSRRARRKKMVLVLVLVLVVVLVAALVVGGRMFLRGNAAASTKPVPGAVIQLEPIYVNLLEGRYLKLGLALQASAAAPKDIDGARALDAAIAVFSNQAMSDLADSATRAQLKSELVTKVAEAYEGQAFDIYFTEFVMQ